MSVSYLNDFITEMFLIRSLVWEKNTRSSSKSIGRLWHSHTARSCTTATRASCSSRWWWRSSWCSWPCCSGSCLTATSATTWASSSLATTPSLLTATSTRFLSGRLHNARHCFLLLIVCYCPMMIVDLITCNCSCLTAAIDLRSSILSWW